MDNETGANETQLHEAVAFLAESVGQIAIAVGMLSSKLRTVAGSGLTEGMHQRLHDIDNTCAEYQRRLAIDD